LSDLWKWHKSESLFDNDNNPTVAGKTETLPGFQAKWLEKDVLQKSDVSWTYFLRVHKKWHKTLTKVNQNFLCQRISFSDTVLKTFCACIDSGDYMHIHNAIKILSEVSAVFPMAAVYDTGGKSLYDSVNALIIREKRNDLKVLGLSYLAQLKSREKEWRKASKPTDVQVGLHLVAALLL
jgi:THO complex subunit 2